MNMIMNIRHMRCRVRKGRMDMNYRVIDKEKYYRSGVFRHFTEDCKCSTSMNARIDVTELVEHSKRTGSNDS